LGKEERILLVSRQHWLVIFGMILPELAVLILLFGGISISLITFQQEWIWFMYILLILPVLSMLRDWMVWWNKQYIITNRRVIKIAGIINKDVTDSSLEKVNDVKLVQSFWGRLMNYGNVHIMTASELGINLFSQIANPIQFKTTMLDAKEKEESEIGDAIKSGMKSNAAPDLILKLGDLRDKGLISEEEFQQKKQEILAKMTS
jgi:uncharacterized membrane protein YdbT with pleckstrin-like domain